MKARNASRIHVQLACELVSEHRLQFGRGTTADISQHGVRLRTSAQLMTGEEVVLSLRDGQSDAFIDGRGCVARVLHGRRAGERTRALAIDFMPMLGESAKRWSQLLARYAA
jgi:hypothetical protein